MLLDSGVKKGRHGGLKSLRLPVALKELIIFSPCLNVQPPPTPPTPPSLHSTAREPAAGNQVDGQAHIIYWKISIHKNRFALQGMRVKKKMTGIDVRDRLFQTKQDFG